AIALGLVRQPERHAGRRGVSRGGRRGGSHNHLAMKGEIDGLRSRLPITVDDWLDAGSLSRTRHERKWEGIDDATTPARGWCLGYPVHDERVRRRDDVVIKARVGGGKSVGELLRLRQVREARLVAEPAARS